MRVAELLQLAGEAFGLTLQAPEICFNQRGSIAGSARPTLWQLRFQPQLLLAHPDVFREQIIPHEVAHLVVFRQFGRVKPHGAEWRYVMTKLFQANAERTHHLTAAGMAKRTFSYSCACPEPHQLTVRRHNNIVRNQAQYRCRRCGETLAATDQSA